MRKIKQRRFRAEAWRNILGRFEASGLTVPVFCARERISMQSLRRWQLRLGGDSDRSLVADTAQLTHKRDDFIDLGNLPSSDSRLEVRLELGAGIVLRIARS